MKKRTFIATIAVALIAGISIFVACKKEENSKQTHVQELVSSAYDKDLSEDELNELIQSYDAKVTVLDSVFYATTYYYMNADFCVKSYTDADNTTFTGLCFCEGDAQHTFTWINDNKIRVDCDDFADSVFLKDFVFIATEGKITFDFKVGEVEHTGTTIEVSETVMESFMGFVNGNMTSLPPSVGTVVGRAIGRYIASKVVSALKENARQCIHNMEMNARDCIRSGGSPSISHNLLHQWCSCVCNMPNPQQ